MRPQSHAVPPHVHFQAVTALVGLAGLLVAEQTAIAAIDCNSVELAFSLANDLRRRFPDSQRALKITVRPGCCWRSADPTCMHAADNVLLAVHVL